ncbi:MAG: DUF502 domain-containing protein [Planctomycetota bacterium]|jgi:uncharacterized membrane protein
MSLSRRFKSYFLHGLAALLPSILTIWLFVWGYTFIQEKISVHINRGLVHVIALAANEGVEISKLKGNLAKTWVEGPGSITGFIVALVAVCVLGALLASYVGRSLWRTVEKFIMNTPVLRNVFPYVKQVTDFLLTNEEQKKLFSRVVAVEYPRKGIWSVGFVTGSGLEKVVNTVKREFLTVIIPTSPTPFTGFVITVQKRQTIDLDMTIEEALRFIVSGGVITPGSEHAVAVLSKPDSPGER